MILAKIHGATVTDGSDPCEVCMDGQNCITSTVYGR